MADVQQISIFRSLKPVCVRLSDEALKARSGNSNPRNVIPSVEDLLRVLESLKSNGRLIDQNLVNYIFFPLSHLFKDKDKFPIRSLELALYCVKILLQTGWRVIEDANTGLQLLVLFTHLAQNRDQEQNITNRSDELITASLECMSELFQSLEPGPGCTSLLFDSASVPAVGHAVTIILDDMKYGASAEVQISAVKALFKFVDGVASREVLQSFVPGIFSALSLVLTPSTKNRRPHRLLEMGLSLLGSAFQLLLSDIECVESGDNGNEKDQKYGNDSWSRATAAQTKLVLANVVKLWQHDRLKVRTALHSLCWTVLEHCPITLSDSVPMILETVIAIANIEGEDAQRLRLRNLISRHPTIGQHAKSSVYESLVSLPRVILANDDIVKDRVTTQVASLVLVLAETDFEMAVIDDLLYRNIRESLLNASRGIKVTQNGVSGQFLPDLPEDESSVFSKTSESQENPRGDEANKSPTDRLWHLIASVSRRKSGLAIANRALENFHHCSSDERIEDLWICFSVLQGRVQVRQSSFNDSSAYLEKEEETLILNTLYDLTISLLSQLDDETERDWRLKILCFEILAFQADQTKQRFRLELSDALYPVVHRLGSTVGPLRTSAMNCLNAMALASGYSDAKELIIGNADYVVNAVGLQFNALDITPQSCRVLLMMIKLCGDSLLPFIEDLVDKIFDALKYFHGYSVLVEQLFAVLEAVVLEGANNSARSQSKDVKQHHRKVAVCPQKIRTLINKITQRNISILQKGSEQGNGPAGNLPHEFPQHTFEYLDSERQAPSPADTTAGDTQTQVANDAEISQLESRAFVPTKIYGMLQRIARLTQYHLPSSSAAIRTSLLSLLIHAVPLLSHHDDSFLPLVHTLWPILLPRLADKEAFVVARVLDLMGCFFQGAGDFLGSRIEGLWPEIQRLYTSGDASAQSISTGSYHGLYQRTDSQQRQKPSSLASSVTLHSSSLLGKHKRLELPADEADAKQQIATYNPAVQDNSRSPFYQPTTKRIVSDALTNFLVKLVSHTRMPEMIYFEILSKMLSPQRMKGEAPELREALANINPDAVWFAMENKEITNLCNPELASARYSSGRKTRTPINVTGGPEFVRTSH